MRRTTRVLVIDEDNLLRDGLCTLLATEEAVEVIGAFNTARQAVRGDLSLRPDLAIVDFSLAERAVAETVDTLRRHWPSIRILVLTAHKESAVVERSLQAGVDGYLLKSNGRKDLSAAVHAVAGGRRYLSPTLVLEVPDPILTGKPRLPDSGPANLTDREREVMRRIALGYRTREIAKQLSLSHKTVEKYRGSLMRKLSLRSATAVAAYAIAHGYLEV